MNYRTLGKTGLHVSELSMGCSCIGKTMYHRDDSGAIATLQKSLDAGINLYDTSPSYSAGDSERLIGDAFMGKRDQVILSSKVGVRGTSAVHFAKRYKHLLRPVRSLISPFMPFLQQFYVSQKRIDYSRDFLVASLEQSLKRLQTDYLDILLLHHPTSESLQHPEFINTFNELKNAGKIRHWGISADTLDIAMLSLDTPGIEVVQVDISIFSHRKPLEHFLAHAREKNVGIIARKVLQQGVLTGSKNQTKADMWVLDKEQLKAIKKKTEQLDFLVTNGRTLTQSALLFVRGLEDVATSLVGYSSLEHLRENLCAYDLPLLTEDENKKIYAL